MHELFYHICDTGICISAPQEIRSDENSRRFSCDNADRADIHVTLSTVEELCLPEPDHTRERCNRERATWQEEGMVFRCSRDLFRQKFHFCAKYPLEKIPCCVECTVREADWHWATQSSYLWPQIMLNQVLLRFRGLVFHAAYICHEGEGILFVAPSGTGKSTQAELWREHRGARIINGDKAAVRLVGTPTAHGMPLCGTSGICENVSLPLKAVVVLSQASGNTVHRLQPSRAVPALCPNLFVDQAVPEEWKLALHLLLDLVAEVPVYALACTPDVRAVEALERAMKEDGA